MLRPRGEGPRALLVVALLLSVHAAALPTEAAAPPAPAGTPAPFLVSFTHPLTPQEHADLRTLGVDPLLYRMLPLAAATLSPEQHAALLARPYVARIDPDHPVELHLDRARALIRAGVAPEPLGFTGNGVTIAVVDSGLDPSHPDLAGRVRASLKYVAGEWREVPVDTDGHGTHVAAIAAGNGAASDGHLQGIAPGADIVSLDFSGSYTTSAAIAAFDWILENRERYGIRVVTNSWGRVGTGVGYDPQDPTILASDRLVQEGLLVIFSASNKGPGPRTLSAEAMNPNVLAVGATDAAGVIAPFSSRGPAYDARTRADMDWVKPDLVADGTRIVSARSPTRATVDLDPSSPLERDYLALSGTSQAAPQIAGLAAVLLEANPRLTPADLMNALRASAIDLGAPGPDPEYGFGLVDTRDALHLALGEAKDLGNILIAGGTETTRHEGRLVGAADRILHIEPASGISPEGRVTIPVAVKPGTTRVQVTFTSRPATTPFELTLTDGTTTLGPWTRATAEGDAFVLHADAAGHFTPGDWTLTATPTTPGEADYTIEVTTTLPPHPEREATLETRYRLHDRPVTWIDTLPLRADYQWDRFARVLTEEMARLEERTGIPAPLLGLAALLAATAAGLAAGRPRRPAPATEQPAREDEIILL